METLIRPAAGRAHPEPSRERWSLVGLVLLVSLGALIFPVMLGASANEPLPGLGAGAGTPGSNDTAAGASTTGETIAPISGDVDCSGQLSAVDALYVLRYVVQLPGAPGCLFAADVQCDNDRDAVDALLILRQIASLPPTTTPPWCPGIGQSLPNNPQLAGGVLVSATAVDESYRVWLTNATGIAMAYDFAWDRLPWRYQGGFFGGPLRSGPGAGEHNAPWSWHLDPNETSIGEGTVEECQGRPSFVEQNVEAWIQLIGRYCPSIDQLVSIVDYRWMNEGGFASFPATRATEGP
jgi:hypothetical protein